jgi:arsenate reductase (glutaredoxin)
VETLTVYALRSCSKSRAVIELLDARGAVFEVIDYVETPPGPDTLGGLVDMVGGDPAQLVRVEDDRFGALGLSGADVGDRSGVIAVLLAHPELMQRPVVVQGTKAVVARPPQLVAGLLD